MVDSSLEVLVMFHDTSKPVHNQIHNTSYYQDHWCYNPLRESKLCIFRYVYNYMCTLFTCLQSVTLGRDNSWFRWKRQCRVPHWRGKRCVISASGLTNEEEELGSNIQFPGYAVGRYFVSEFSFSGFLYFPEISMYDQDEGEELSLAQPVTKLYRRTAWLNSLNTNVS